MKKDSESKHMNMYPKIIFKHVDSSRTIDWPIDDTTVVAKDIAEKVQMDVSEIIAVRKDGRERCLKSDDIVNLHEENIFEKNCSISPFASGRYYFYFHYYSSRIISLHRLGKIKLSMENDTSVPDPVVIGPPDHTNNGEVGENKVLIGFDRLVDQSLEEKLETLICKALELEPGSTRVKVRMIKCIS